MKRSPPPPPDADPPFTATVEAGMTDDGIWLVRATIRFRDGFPPDGSRLLGEGRLALLVGIAEAGKRGRELGADRCRVFLDTGERVSEFTLGDDVPDLGPLH